MSKNVLVKMLMDVFWMGVFWMVLCKEVKKINHLCVENHINGIFLGVFLRGWMSWMS